MNLILNIPFLSEFLVVLAGLYLFWAILIHYNGQKVMSKPIEKEHADMTIRTITLNLFFAISTAFIALSFCVLALLV